MDIDNDIRWDGRSIKHELTLESLIKHETVYEQYTADEKVQIKYYMGHFQKMSPFEIARLKRTICLKHHIY